MSTPAPRIAFFTSADGYTCSARVWDVPEPAASLVFLHGIISHGGWYPQSCRYLARAGFEVHFLDRRGSGLNAAARGEVDAFQTWLGDVEGYLEQLPTGPPRILLGISWGGKLAAAVARHRPELVDGLGLICPGLFAQKGAGRAGRAALALARILRLEDRRVTIPLQDPTLFADLPEWQAYIDADPLTLRQVTIRFALADLELTRYATEAPREISSPVLLMLAGRDRIINNRLVRDFVERTVSSDKSVIEYPQAAHTLEFEPDPSPFFEDLRRWASKVAAAEGQ